MSGWHGNQKILLPRHLCLRGTLEEDFENVVGTAMEIVIVLYLFLQ
jgi:hypothetical protein